jgi:hypothetical protein
MVDDLLETKAFELVGLGAKLFDVTLLARPFGRGNVVAALREVVGEVLPAPRGEQAPWISIRGAPLEGVDIGASRIGWTRRYAFGPPGASRLRVKGAMTRRAF